MTTIKTGPVGQAPQSHGFVGGGPGCVIIGPRPRPHDLPGLGQDEYRKFKMPTQAERIEKDFKAWDRNGNGSITAREWTGEIGCHGGRYADRGNTNDFREADANQDGKVDRFEFTVWKLKQLLNPFSKL